MPVTSFATFLVTLLWPLLISRSHASIKSVRGGSGEGEKEEEEEEEKVLVAVEGNETHSIE